MLSRRRTPGWGWLLVSILLGSVAGLALRLGLFALSACLLPVIGALVGFVLTHVLFVDPVYTRAAQDSLGNLHLQALAIAGPPGHWLHERAPDMFASPARAHWVVARLILASGSAVLGRLVAAGLTHALVLAIGLLVVRHGWRTRSRPVIAFGCAIQLQVAASILDAQLSVRDLESTGVSFAINALAPWLQMRGVAVTDAVAGAAPSLVAAALVGLALIVAYVPSAVLLAVRSHARGLMLVTASSVVLSSAACAGALQVRAAASAANTVGPPIADDMAVSKGLASRPPEPVLARGTLVIDRWYVDATRVSGPSDVQVVLGSDGQFRYVVNGEQQVIRGMGLNTQYASQLSPAERATRIDADMAALAGLGVNTVLGWDPAEFDGVLLDAAQRYNIGVVVPFDLDPEVDYTDPTVRGTLHAQVMDWVERYKGHPALRMWGLGNEVLHKIVHPAWVGPQEPARERNAEAFSDWLIATADDIHAADPHHPVTYRSAEDAFVDWLSAAFARRGGGPRPWFVFGTNCYQKYLSDIVDNWPQSGLPVALWVSEFAPGTMAVPDRPEGFAQMWGWVRRHPAWVLGGAVYAWTRNGPEGVDRNFGLTDDGMPVDGRSLAMLGSLFKSD
ncbi:MAG: hypothetical protein NVSMB2_18890 [Chloroflexota bacterium]